jgi:hypothetical protein
LIDLPLESDNQIHQIVAFQRGKFFGSQYSNSLRLWLVFRNPGKLTANQLR